VLGRAPTAFGHLLCALDLLLGPRREIAIVGEPDHERTGALVNEIVAERYLPNVVLARASPDRVAEDGAVVPLLEGRVVGEPSAFVCERFVCRLPARAADDLVAQLA
jgi:uncharacterized protein YyaL (SSP411 family)